MQTEFSSHPSEDILERYALGRVGDDESAPIEEHLLVCEMCQIRLREADDYRVMMRNAAQVLSRRTAARPTWQFWPVWAAAAAAFAIAIILPWQSYFNVKTQEVSLEVTRGGDQQLLAQAPAGQPIAIKVDLTELAPSPSYRLDLVNSAGTLIWRGVEPARNGHVRAALPGRLSAGEYWVRLYLPTLPPSLLREYGLKLR